MTYKGLYIFKSSLIKYHSVLSYEIQKKLETEESGEINVGLRKIS